MAENKSSGANDTPTRGNDSWREYIELNEPCEPPQPCGKIRK